MSKPSTPIHHKDFRYTPAHATDLRKTFKKIRKAQEKSASTNVVAIKSYRVIL